jgi:hypothetical protein
MLGFLGRGCKWEETKTYYLELPNAMAFKRIMALGRSQDEERGAWVLVSFFR